MKKSVLLILVFLSAGVFLWVTNAGVILSGLGVLDLPPPPPPPGLDVAQPDMVSDTYDDMVIYVPQVQQQVQQPVVQAPVPSAQMDTSAFQTLEARVNTLQSKVDQLGVDVENANRFVRKPVVEQPAFNAAISKVQRNALVNTALVTVFIGLLVCLVIGFFVNQSLRKKRQKEADLETIEEYFHNYERQGYDRAALKEHLRASGWSDEVIDDAEKKMWV